MADGRQVYIHAGAHRTGTSSFQQCLYENRAALAEAGFVTAYPGRDQVPQGRLKLPLPRKRHGKHRVPGMAAKVARHLGRIAPTTAGHLILSEENLPGLMRGFYDGEFMAGSVNRLATLRAGIGVQPTHVIYVVRSYDAMLVSAFRKRAEDNKVQKFSEVRDVLTALDRGWAEVVVELRDVLQPKRLTVVDYPARGSSVDLLRILVPVLAGANLVEPDRALNLSATDAALEALQARYAAGETLDRAAWQAVVAEHAGQSEDRGFAAFTDAQAKTLQDRHARALDEIDAMDGVTLIRA